MKKTILIFLLIGIMFLNNVEFIHGDEYKKFEMKHGMRERTVNEKYGQPLLTEKIKSIFIPKKKSLYQLDESTHMIIYFSAGFVSKINFLEDMESEEAISIFKE